MSDPISDLLATIRNAIKVKTENIDVPSSNLKVSLVKVLKDEGYIKNYKVLEDTKRKQGVLKVQLKYDDNKVCAIEGLKRVSKPSMRKYTKKDKIPRTLDGFGITIVSTSKGIMTDELAKKENVGGEVICQIW